MAYLVETNVAFNDKIFKEYHVINDSDGSVRRGLISLMLGASSVSPDRDDQIKGMIEYLSMEDRIDQTAFFEHIIASPESYLSARSNAILERSKEGTISSEQLLRELKEMVGVTSAFECDNDHLVLINNQGLVSEITDKGIIPSAQKLSPKESFDERSKVAADLGATAIACQLEILMPRSWSEHPVLLSEREHDCYGNFSDNGLFVPSSVILNGKIH